MPAAHPWTAEQLQDILSAYSKGESAVSIARRSGVSYPIIRPLLQKHGIVLRSRAEVRRVNTCNHAYFHAIDTEEKAYWLGFLTADGCITTGNRIAVHLGTADCSHLFKLKMALAATQTVSSNTRSCALVICSPEMAADLAAHGILPKKTFSTKPAQIAPELARHYWRGVIDGDGYISKAGNGLVLVGDYEIVLQFQAFALARCPEMKAGISRKENIYQIQLSGKGARNMLEIIYSGASVFLERKYELAK